MSIRRLKARGIGRLELLGWLNELLETDYTKIEHLADGIAYCQVLDALHPDKVPLQQVLFHAKSHAEYERNFRVLRRAFQVCDIHKEIPVKKLVDGIFQEHFEFLHWLHDYAHKTYPDAVRKYQGFARRQHVLQSGHSPMSIRELDNANMNLVPSYAASSKGTPGGFLRSGRLALALDIIDPEDVPNNLTLDDLVGEAFHPIPSRISEPVETASQNSPHEHTRDPLLRFVEHSYATTVGAERLLSQLEKTMAIVLTGGASTAVSKTKKPRDSGKPSQAKTTKPRRPPEASSDPPFLAPQLDELIDVLANELAARAEDLKTVEEEVQRLVECLTNPMLDPQATTE